MITFNPVVRFDLQVDLFRCFDKIRVEIFFQNKSSDLTFDTRICIIKRKTFIQYILEKNNISNQLKLHYQVYEENLHHLVKLVKHHVDVYHDILAVL